MPPVAERPAPPAEMGVSDYVGVLSRRWVSIVGLTLLVPAVVAGYCLLATPEYAAEATLLMETEDISAGTFTSEIVTATRKDLFSRAQFYATERELIRSRSYLQAIVDQAELWSDCGLGGDDPIQTLIDATEVEGEQVSKLSRVVVEHEDPACAARLANAIAANYVERNLEAARGKFLRDIANLGPEIERLRGRVAESLAEGEAYKEQHGLITLEAPAAEEVKKLGELDLALTQAQVRRIELEKRYALARRYAEDPGRIESLPAAIADPVVARLRTSFLTLEADYAQLLERYRPRHPTMQRKRAQLDQLRADIRAELERVVDGLGAEYRATLDQESSLAAEVEAQRQVALARGASGLRAGLILDEARQWRGLFESVSSKIVEAEIVANIKANNVRIVDPAEVPLEPSHPQTALFVALGLGAGLVLGLTFAFVRDALDSTVRTPEDVARGVGLAVAATLPRRRDAGGLAGRPGGEMGRLVALLEAERQNAAIPPDRAQVVTVGGCDGGEGATEVAAGLARAAARAGRQVLAVDGRPDRPQLAALLGVTDGPGLREWIQDGVPLRDAARPTDTEGLHVICAGPGSASTALRLDRLREVLESAAAVFDLVVVDAPPLSTSGLALTLAGASDLVLVLVEAGWTRTEEIEAAVRALRSVEPLEARLVLNRYGQVREEPEAEARRGGRRRDDGPKLAHPEGA